MRGHHLACQVEEKLGAYPTTLEADAAALASKGLPPFSNQRHAVIQVTTHQKKS